MAFDPDSTVSALSGYIKSVAEVRPVVLYYPVPEVGWDIARVNYMHYLRSGEVLQDLMYDKSVYEKRHAFIIDAFKKMLSVTENVRAIRSDRIFCDEIIGSQCVAQIGGASTIL